MTPEQLRSMIDQFDVLKNETPIDGPFPTDTEAGQEWGFLHLAVDAIRLHAIAEKVLIVMLASAGLIR
jgi:hypothetical protein